MKMRYVVVFGVALACSGCVTNQAMPDGHYEELGVIMGGLQKCFEAEHISAKLYADSRIALSYMLSTWQYDPNKLGGKVQSAYGRTIPTAARCRRTSATVYEIIARVDQRQANIKENTAAWNNAFNQVNNYRPVYCYTVSGVTMCN